MFDYATELEVREDLVEAYRGTWRHVGATGTWWTGVERVAIAGEVRRAMNCDLCLRRKEALSPYSVDGRHEHAQVLPDAIVDIVHRIATDSGRLTRDWFDSLDLDDTYYIELLGVVGSMVAIDTFNAALGVPLEVLPEAQFGEPTRARPEVKDIGAWVPVLDRRRDPLGPKLFRLPVAPNVVYALSLVPDETRNQQRGTAAQYVPPASLAKLGGDVGRAISRAQIEFVAARVSTINECFY